MKWSVLLVVCLSGSAIVFAALVYLVWLNRGGERVPLLFLKAVCGPLLVTLFLVGYELAKPLEISRTTVPLMFYRAGNSLIANRQLIADETLPTMPGAYVDFEAAYVNRMRSII